MLIEHIKMALKLIVWALVSILITAQPNDFFLLLSHLSYFFHKIIIKNCPFRNYLEIIIVSYAWHKKFKKIWCLFTK